MATLGTEAQRNKRKYNREYSKKYHSLNRDVCLKKARLYKQKNKDRLKLYYKEYYKKNKKIIDSKHKERYGSKNSKKYYKTHREKCLLYAKHYRSKNKESISLKRSTTEYKQYMQEYSSRWRVSPVGKVCLNNSKHTRRSIYRTTDITSAWLKDIKSSSNPCPICGVNMVDIMYDSAQKTLDHIIPLNKKCNGQHIMSNVRIICRQCNLKRPKDGSDILISRSI